MAKRLEQNNISVRSEQLGAVRVITIDKPRRMNALDPNDVRDLAAELHSFNADPESRAAVLTGSGSAAFCAGADLKWAAENPQEAAAHEVRTAETRRSTFRRSHTELAGEMPAEIWKPLIAAVNGYCLGGGLEMALQCDLIFASESATFGFPEVGHGWTPAAGGMFWGPRNLPLKIAMELLLVAEPITAQRAYEVGMVNRVIPSGNDLVGAAVELANRIALYDPAAVQCVKEIAMRGLDQPLDYPPTAWTLLNSDVHNRVLDPNRVSDLRASSTLNQKAVKP